MVLIFPHCLNLIIKSLIFLTSQLYVRILSLESNIDSAGILPFTARALVSMTKG